jgi:TonB family protein
MSRIVFVISFLLLSFYSDAQIQPYAVSKDAMFTDPHFPGGKDAMLSFIKKNVQYPDIAKQVGIIGNVQLKVTISVDGTIAKVAVTRGVGAGCDEEALRLIQSMPQWQPAERRGKKIAYTIIVEVPFGDRKDIVAQEVKTNYIFNQGIELQKTKDYWGSIDKFTDAIAMSPYIDCDAYYNRGVSFYYLEDLENACIDWEKGLKYEHDLSRSMYEKYCSHQGEN